MPTKMEEEINRMHKDIEEIKETLGIFMESYIEMAHATLENDKDVFISLESYKKKHGI